MPSGLIQLVSLGVNDIFLTGDPEITFFKIVYRRYTNFSIQTIELNFEETPDFGKKLTCNIPSNGDLIHKVYLKIDIPAFPSFDFNKINIPVDNSYIEAKNNKISNIKKEIIEAEKKYNNMKNFAYYIIEAYKVLLDTMLATNVELIDIKSVMVEYNSKNINEIKQVISLIDLKINTMTNIISYIINFERFGKTNFLEKIKQQTKKQYEILINYTHTFYLELEEKKKILNNLNNNNIDFAWIKYLGNFIFKTIELEIGGHVIEKKTNDWTYLMSQANLKISQKDIYNQLIGNIDSLTEFNNSSKDSYTLLIPLDFSFNKHPGLSLPLVALRYQDVNINIDMNDVKNCCYFEDYEKMYNSVKIIQYDELRINDDKIMDNEGYLLFFKNLKYNKTFNSYTYIFEEINYKILSSKYSLNQEDIIYLLKKYGTVKAYSIENTINTVEISNTINLSEFINMIYSKNIKTYHILESFLNILPFKYKQSILNTIHLQNASLLVDYIYLDNLERQKFAQSKHEYLIEEVYENSKPISTVNNIYAELSFYHPVKELLWFVRPKSYIFSPADIFYESKYWNYSASYFDTLDKSGPILKSRLDLNNISIFPDNQDNLFFNELQSYKCYSNSFPKGVNVYSFSLFPTEYQPSGSCNFTTFKSKILRLLLDKEYFKEHNDNIQSDNIMLYVLCSSYNILRIMGGMAAIGFS